MERIGPYEPITELGRGGFGAVYRARDSRSGREVALKVLLAAGLSAEQLLRFEREARALLRVRDPGLAELIDAGNHRGRPWLALELIEGNSLETLLRAGPFPVPRAIETAHALASTLGRLHAAGVVHRDVKPANVVIGRDGQPVLLDLGLALLLDTEPRLTASGEVMGTPGYFPPEMALGRPDLTGPRTDVYQLGATLFALLTGSPPFENRQLLAVLQAVVSGPAPAPSSLRAGLDPRLDAICARCLAKRPEDRYPDMQSLALDLERARTPPRTSRSSWIFVGAGVVALSGVTWMVRAPTAEPGSDPAATGSRAARTDPAPDLAEAEALLGRGEVSRALLKLEPHRSPPRARLLRAHALRRSYLLALASEEYERVLADEPDHPEALSGRAKLRSLRGDHFGAIEDCSRALKAAPGSREALLLRANARVETEEVLLALEDIERALAIEERWVAARLLRARLLQDLGNVSARLTELREIARIDAAAVDTEELERLEQDRDVWTDEARAAATSEEGFVHRAMAREHTGDLSGAIEDWSAAIERQPGPDRSRWLLSRAQVRFILRDVGGAIRDVEAAGEVGGADQASCRYMAAFFRLAAGDRERALEDLRGVAEVEPGHQAAWNLIGKLLQSNPASLGEAAHAFEQALKEPTSKDPHRPRWGIDIETARNGQKEVAIRRALLQEPVEPADPAERARARLARGDLAGARDACQRALEQDPASVPARLTRARALQLGMSSGAALVDLDAVLAREPGHVEALELRIQVLEFLFRWAEAARDLEALGRLEELKVRRKELDQDQARIEVLVAQGESGGGDEVMERAAELYRLGAKDRAAVLMDRLVEVAPYGTTAPLLTRAIHRIDGGDLDGAAADLEVARRRAPRFAPLHVAIAELRRARGDLEGAEEAAAAAIELGTEEVPDEEPRQLRAILRELRGDLLGALDDASRLEQNADHAREIRARIGARLESLGVR